MASAPADSHQPIVYPIAVLSNAKQSKPAEEFIAYLFSAESKSIFEKYGFSISE
jgi:molybdate transport system substrate-binding protein